jgi:ABC-type cobalamin/Fe3+-siderophores transport system ATPase subunit
MNRVTIDLEHCYGIKKLQADLDFTQQRVYALYAPNGVMKSSLAQTFLDLSQGKESRDRIFAERLCKREILDEAKCPIDDQSVFVVRPYDEEFSHTERTSILLVDAPLRKEWVELQSGIEKQKGTLLKALKQHSKSKKNLEVEISSAFTSTEEEFETALTRIKTELTEMHDAVFGDVPYDTVFDENVLAFLRTEEAQAIIEIYVKRYNELLATSTFFRKGTFDYYNAGQIAKSLANNGFFEAKHTVTLYGQTTQREIRTQRELEDVVAKEKEAILKDKELQDRFNALAKLLEKNVQMREFQKFLLDHESYVSQLANVAKFRENVLKSYLKICFELYEQLMGEYEAAKARRREIQTEAAKQRTQWETVIQIFNDRFVVPFTLEATNRTAVMLGAEPIITLGFTYHDGSEKRDVERASLLEALSTGEKKALYVLNIIFEVESRRKAQQETLIVVDDIADSFDYQNKYAIIQYLKDIGQDPLFKLVIMTHNFDFFRTLESRFVSYNHCLMATKSSAGITLGKVSGIRNVFNNDLKANFFTDPKKKIASIPFIRNLVEYTKGEADADYLKLTSMLHVRPDSATITEADLDQIYNKTFSKSMPLSNGKPIHELVDEQAQTCMTAPAAANFENKIVLAMAVRLGAERFMQQKLNDPGFVAAISGHQTQTLMDEYRKRFGANDPAIGTLDRVVLMTPENIHLNSFMYEPIVDMSDEQLRRLYSDVLALK